MGRFRQSSGSTRAAISVIALYALFLQGFLAAAVEASAFESAGGAICAAPDPGNQSPDGNGHHHGLCCVLACAACGYAFLTLENGGFAVSEQLALPLIWLPAASLARYQPFRTYLGARGPPQTI
ncbi:MAG: hypothetical protein L0Y50_14110 [Beijerinckiaceae bacterium]|nr:hypothetical protein [Beijerinckiaceae bacterium]MCI0737382.1 hypothetical protein [Beijerinckiaceae bacterium]